MKHRFRMAKDPSQVNLRRRTSCTRSCSTSCARAASPSLPGNWENVTTRGVDLLGLPVGTLLRLGARPSWRSPGCASCAQIDDFQKGLLKQVVGRD